MPFISLIAACSDNRAIGYKGRIPWHIPEDLQFFKEKTKGKPIIMGRVTYETLPFPLPQRKHIILSRSPYKAPQDMIVCSSFKEALEQAKPYLKPDDPEIMVIGGDAIYHMALPFAKRIYLTEVATTVEGDAFFPTLPHNEWKEVSRKKGSPHNLTYHFVTYERIS